MFYKNYYADVLCINKDKPEMHCNGQCAFMQKVKSQEKSETPISNVVYKLFESLWYNDLTCEITAIHVHVFSSFQFPTFSYFTLDGAAFDFEKPPAFSLI